MTSEESVGIVSPTVSPFLGGFAPQNHEVPQYNPDPQRVNTKGNTNMALNNFTCALVLDVSMLKALAADPDAGKKLAQAVQNKLFDATGTATVTYGDKTAVEVIEVHQADSVRLVAIGGNSGRDIGAAGTLENMNAGNERSLFEAATANYDLVVRKEAVRGEKGAEGGEKPSESPATTTDAPAAS